MKHQKFLLLGILASSLVVNQHVACADTKVSADTKIPLVTTSSADTQNYNLLFEMLSNSAAVAAIKDHDYIEMRLKTLLQHLESTTSKDVEVLSNDIKVQSNDIRHVSLDVAPVNDNKISVTKKFNIEKLQIAEDHVYSGMRQFLDKYKKKHFTNSYCETIMKSFVDLIEEDGSNIYSVLYFMALCSVESNFDQDVPTKYGVGIAQVVYRIHKKYISELGVSKYEFYHSPSHNIYVGYNIFKCYLKSNKYSCHRAATRYNGGATKGYANNVTSRFNFLLSLIKQLHYRKT